MKTLTVKKLIKLLSKVDQDCEVVLEGCDCAEDCVGISLSLGDGPYRDQVLLRREDGAFKFDKLKIIKKVSE